MTYPHRWEALICAACGADGVFIQEHSDCPAAMRAHIAELTVHVGSLHKAYAKGRDEERANVVKHLRTASRIANHFADEIQCGEHLETE